MKLVAFNSHPECHPMNLQQSLSLIQCFHISLPVTAPKPSLCAANAGGFFFLSTSWHKPPDDILPFDVLLELGLSGGVGGGCYVDQCLAVVCDAQTAQQ